MLDFAALMAPLRERSPLAVLFLTVFLDLLGFGMVIPILPLYAKTLGASKPAIGLLLASYSAMQLLWSPIWGRVSDRAGRRPVLLLSIFGSCVSQLGYALAPTLPWLIVARAVAGICGANVTAAQAYVADVTDEKSRAGGMGMLGVAMGLGFVFGPAIGGALAHLDPRYPFFFASALAAVNFALAWPILVEPRPAGERSAARTLTWGDLRRTVATPRLLSLILLLFTVSFGFANLEGTFSLFLEAQFGYRETSASYLFVFIGGCMIVTQGALVRPLVARVGERALVIAGTALMAASMLMLHFADGLALLLPSLALLSLGNGLNNPSLSSLISRAAAGDRQGGVLGVSQAASACARMVGPLAGTYALGFGNTLPYLIGGAVMLVASLFAVLRIEQPRGAAVVGAPPTS